MVKCDWCDIAKEKNINCIPENCDFKTLKMDKEAILQRMKEETQKIYDLKMEVVKQRLKPQEIQERVALIFDKAKGMDVMMYVLKGKYMMRNKTIFEKIEKKTLSQEDSFKFALKVLEVTRGGK